MPRLLSPHSDAALAERVRQLAAAFAAFRRLHGQPGRRIPLGLQKQVLDAIDAGVAATTLQKTCGVSQGQVRRWRSAAASAGRAVEADFLSVVEEASPASKTSPAITTPPAITTSPDTDVVVCVGPWRLSLRRVAG